MPKSGECDAASRAVTTLARSNAVHTAVAVGTVFLAVSLVTEAASTVGAAYVTDRTVTPTEPLWIPLVLGWASALVVLLARWLWQTTPPDDIGGEG